MAKPMPPDVFVIVRPPPFDRLAKLKPLPLPINNCPFVAPEPSKPVPPLAAGKIPTTPLPKSVAPPEPPPTSLAQTTWCEAFTVSFPPFVLLVQSRAENTKLPAGLSVMSLPEPVVEIVKPPALLSNGPVNWPLAVTLVKLGVPVTPSDVVVKPPPAVPLKLPTKLPVTPGLKVNAVLPCAAVLADDP